MAIKIEASLNDDSVTDLVIEEDVVVETVVDFAPDLATDIGARLKLIRERNGLSQRELAKRAGITNSNISMIEQGLVSPSVNSLAKVLGGIPMSLGQFFACNQVDIGQVVFLSADLQKAQNVIHNGIVTRSVAAEKIHRQLDMKHHTYPAGSDTGAEPMRAKSEVSGIVVTGQIELTAGMQIYELNEGDAFYLATLQPYRIRNRRDQEAVVVLTALCE